MHSAKLHRHTRQGLHAWMKKWQTHSCRVLGTQLDLGSDSNNPCRSNLCRRAVSRLHACRVSRRKAQEYENYSGDFSTQLQGHMNQRGLFFPLALSLTGPRVGERLCYLFSHGSGSLTQSGSCQRHTFTQESSTPHSTHGKTPLNISTSLSHVMLSVLFSKCRKSLVWEAQGHTTDILELWFSTFQILPPFNTVLHVVMTQS